jgi:hypothetical protein
MVASPARPSKDVGRPVRPTERERHAVDRQVVDARIVTRNGRDLDSWNAGAQFGVDACDAATIGREILGEKQGSTVGHHTVPR